LQEWNPDWGTHSAFILSEWNKAGEVYQEWLSKRGPREPSEPPAKKLKVPVMEA
jgi:hypothetical protein